MNTASDLVYAGEPNPTMNVSSDLVYTDEPNPTMNVSSDLVYAGEPKPTMNVSSDLVYTGEPAIAMRMFEAALQDPQITFIQMRDVPFSWEQYMRIINLLKHNTTVRSLQLFSPDNCIEHTGQPELLLDHILELLQFNTTLCEMDLYHEWHNDDLYGQRLYSIWEFLRCNEKTHL